LKIDLHIELKYINLKNVAVYYLNENKKMTRNKLHHEIPNLFRFIFQFLDPIYLKSIQNEKRISGVVRISTNSINFHKYLLNITKEEIFTDKQ